MTANYQKRLSNLRHILEHQQLEALLVSRPENVFYISGFSGGEGQLLVTQQESYLFADGRYKEQALQEASPCFQQLALDNVTCTTDGMSFQITASVKEVK